MRIGDVMNRRTARISIDAPMSLAAELLVLSQASDLMVVDDKGHYIGVLAEGDMLHAIMPDFEGLMESGASLEDAFRIFSDAGTAYADQPIGRLVIRKSITVGPDDELLKAATVMVTKQIRRLAVVEGERLVGSVSRADVCWAVLCDAGGRTPSDPLGGWGGRSAPARHCEAATSRPSKHATTPRTPATSSRRSGRLRPGHG
jgi:CBS domain-containing protein